MTAPIRVQLKRVKGWRMPPNTVKVDRSTPFGNPFYVEKTDTYWGVYNENDSFVAHAWTREAALSAAVALFSARVQAEPPALVKGLRGKNVACWCPLDAPCHADVLLELANR